MKIEVYCDASFFYETSTAGIAIIILDEYQHCLLKSSRKIICKNTSDAELRAINKAVGYLVDRQKKSLLPLGCTITIKSDNQGIINKINKKLIIKHVGKDIMGALFRNIRLLEISNDVIFDWISRKKNKEADNEARATLNTSNP